MAELKNIICINIGSQTKKYSVFKEGQFFLESEIENNNQSATDSFWNNKIIDTNNLKIAIRIVAPGRFFTENKKIDSEYVNKLKESSTIFPLHINLVISEIEYLTKKFGELELYALSDSGFHKNIPKYAKTYALPKEIMEKYGIEKQGYHGLSLSYSLAKLKNYLGYLPKKIVVCHLGGGSSVTAIYEGSSIDTSMGWTPLQGVPMSERVGDIDPGVIAFLAQKLDFSSKTLEEFLSKECGLEAVSGIDTGDMREIIKKREIGDKDANLAFNIYIYSIKKYIGAMTAVLNGVDLLLLTGAISEKSFIIRQALFEDTSYLGINLDFELNKKVSGVQDIEELGLAPNKNKIIVLKTNESEEMFKQMEKFSY